MPCPAFTRITGGAKCFIIWNQDPDKRYTKIMPFITVLNKKRHSLEESVVITSNRAMNHPAAGQRDIFKGNVTPQAAGKLVCPWQIKPSSASGGLNVLSFYYRNIIPFIQTGINLPWSVELPVRVLHALFPLAYPTGQSAYGKHNGKHIERYAQRP